MHISPNSSSENRLIFNAHSSSFVKSKNQEQDPLTCLSLCPVWRYFVFLYCHAQCIFVARR